LPATFLGNTRASRGVGGAPEGVLTAAAMRCLDGEIHARLVTIKPEDEQRCRATGIDNCKRIYRSADLASGENIVFVATGVTDGSLLEGVSNPAHHVSGDADGAAQHSFHRHDPPVQPVDGDDPRAWVSGGAHE
jgi:fructose-1,6-bisphosphatase/sedoheptulose 1,7-bisphosphatase-like protein